MKVILSKRGHEILVDDHLYPTLSRFKWNVNNYGYAYHGSGDNKIFMHKELAKILGAELVDHEDRNTLNNQLSNLRPCTQSQNMANRVKYTKSTHSSTYKGVHFCNRSKRWIAKIKLDGKSKYIGAFRTEVEGAVAYNKKAKELFGEFCVLNEVE